MGEDRTFINDKNNRGQDKEKSAETALYPIWQPIVEELRTFRDYPSMR